MGKPLDLTGQRFGRLLVIKKAESIRRKNSTEVRWLCQCDCGNETIVRSTSLRSGRTVSCGCRRKELNQNVGEMRKQGHWEMDLTGRRFGRLTVIERGPDKIDLSGHHRVQWNCRCDCGNEITVRGDVLRRGDVKSCGCLWNEMIESMREEFRNHNRYEIYGEIVKGYTFNGGVFYFDLEDWDLVTQYCWTKDFNGYIVSRDPVTGESIRIHRLVMHAREGEVVDHINHQTTNNCKSNLRIVTQRENQANARIQKNNTSGVCGVNFDWSRNKWQAYITHEGKRMQLGRFDCFEDAVIARKEAEEQYFGEYSFDNSIAASPVISL